jgi:hypothetical protein
MAPLIDHLWQSMLVTALVAALGWFTRQHSAALHLWMWRVAALKFLLPFGLAYGLGGWMGCPVRHNAIAPPAGLLNAVAAGLPWASPAQSLEPGPLMTWAFLVLALLLSLASGLLIRWQALRAGARLEQQSARTTTDWAQSAPRLGFCKSVTLSGIAAAALVTPILAGALHDRVSRQQALVIDIATLQSAEVRLTPVTTRFGGRSEVVATTRGVVIHHINLQDLVALVYGIDRFEVFGGALPWLERPHYDVRVAGKLSAPEIFDAYALRQPVTTYLQRQFGVSIRVNGNCQEPCVNQESFTVERIPWTLSKRIGGQN